MSRAGSKVATVEDSLDSGVSTLPNDLLKEK